MAVITKVSENIKWLVFITHLSFSVISCVTLLATRIKGLLPYVRSTLIVSVCDEVIT